MTNVNNSIKSEFEKNPWVDKNYLLDNLSLDPKSLSEKLHAVIVHICIPRSPTVRDWRQRWENHRGVCRLASLGYTAQVQRQEPAQQGGR